MLRGLAVLCCAVVISLASACSSGKCESGTLRYGDECVISDPFDKTPPVLTIDPDLYTRHVGTVHITSDKPATIYYTLDGSPATTDSASGADEVVIPNVPDTGAVLRVFAIDLSGNKSAEVVRVWVIDQDGPGGPLDFHLSLGTDMSTRTVTWGMPPDPRPGGVLIARVDGKLGAGPVSGQTYNVGDKISPDVTIVSVGGKDPTGTFTESMPAGPGLVRYVGWAFDSLQNYGPPAGDFTVVAMPAQTATVNIDETTGNVTIMNAPSLLGLTGNATVTTTTTTTVTLNLSLKNTTSRTLYAPKLVLTNTLPATPTQVSWSDSDGTIGTGMTAPMYRAYGGALPAGATSTQTYTFTNITGPGTLSLALAFRDDPVLTFQSWNTGPSIIDTASGNDIVDLPYGSLGKNGDSRVTASSFTPEGNLITAQRESCKVIMFSINSSRELARASLCGEFGYVASLVSDHSSSVVYAVISENRPKARSHFVPIPTSLVRLDAGVLQEYGPRIDLGLSITRALKISPDDKTIIIATAITAQGVIIVDAPTFTIRKRLIPDFKVETVAIAPDGKSFAAVGDSTFAVYDMAGNLILQRPLPGTPGTFGESRMTAEFGSKTQLWFSRIGEVDSVDIFTGDARTFAYGGYWVSIFDGKLYTSGSTYNQAARFDLDGNQDLLLPGINYPRGNHWMGRSPF